MATARSEQHLAKEVGSEKLCDNSERSRRPGRLLARTLSPPSPAVQLWLDTPHKAPAAAAAACAYQAKNAASQGEGNPFRRGRAIFKLF